MDLRAIGPREQCWYCTDVIEVTVRENDRVGIDVPDRIPGWRAGQEPIVEQQRVVDEDRAAADCARRRESEGALLVHNHYVRL